MPHPVIDPADTRSVDASWTRAKAEAINRDGIAGLPQAFPRQWAEDLAADFTGAFAHALSYPGGTIGRGPKRHYFAVHPEQLSRFVDLVTLPAFVAICAEVLGADYRIIEVGFDVPLPGAVDQPWHRDFRMSKETRDHRRLTSLVLNVTTVDVSPDMGPFEIAPGTQWDPGDSFAHGMFPEAEEKAHYASLGQQRRPKQGDMSLRSGLTLHRGTANRSDRPRPVLTVGIVTPEVAESAETDVHSITVTRHYFERLPELVRRHLRCRVVDELSPIVQAHDIEGLVMG